MSPQLNSQHQSEAMAGSCQAAAAHSGGASSPLVLLQLDPAGGWNDCTPMLGTAILRVICDNVLSAHTRTRSLGDREQHVKWPEQQGWL